MRVIAGTYKGHPLQTVSNKLTRPTTDKVKESLFNIIGPFFDGGICLDLFAGSGGLGIEALSRGMNHVVFVDQQKQAIQVIHSNLQALKLEGKAEVYRNDAFRAIKATSKRALEFDLIILDPPYQKISYESLLMSLTENNVTHQNTIIVCEHDTKLSLPKEHAGFIQMKTDNYGGTTAISLYKRKEEVYE